MGREEIVIRGLLILSCLVALAIAGSLVTAEQEQAWFDIENCALCKNLGNEEGLLQNIRWETHLTANGAVTLTQVPAEYEEAFARAQKHIEETASKMGSGEPMHLCGFCQSYGMLMMSGVKVESFQGEVARVTLMTSSDDKVVEMIHAHAQKTVDAYKKWLAEEATHKG
jgi:hypothetical protein